jgi:hypothetical protein
MAGVRLRCECAGRRARYDYRVCAVGDIGIGAEFARHR